MEQHQADRAVLLAAAAAELLKAHALLAEHAVALGHVDKLLKMMQTNAPPAEGGCFLPRHTASCFSVIIKAQPSMAQELSCRLPEFTKHLAQQSGNSGLIRLPMSISIQVA